MLILITRTGEPLTYNGRVVLFPDLVSVEHYRLEGDRVRVYLGDAASGPGLPVVEKVAKALRDVPYTERFNWELQARAALSAIQAS